MWRAKHGTVQLARDRLIVLKETKAGDKTLVLAAAQRADICRRLDRHRDGSGAWQTQPGEPSRLNRMLQAHLSCQPCPRFLLTAPKQEPAANQHGCTPNKEGNIPIGPLLARHGFVDMVNAK